MKEDKVVKALKEAFKGSGFTPLEGEEAVKFMQEMQKRFPDVEKSDEEVMKNLKPYEGKYKWLPGMAEISGMHGTYEEACRRMVQRGLEWFDHYTEKHPLFSGYEGVYGLINSENEDAKELKRVMLAAADEIDPNGGTTGAMMQASTSTVLWVKKKGWDTYVKEMSKNENNHR